MSKHEYLTCLELHKRLKQRIMGDMFIVIDDRDTLIIHINASRGIKYKYEYKYISNEIIYGELDYDKVIRIIMYDYKEFIMNKFFRR